MSLDFELNYNPKIGVSVNRVHIVIIICYKKALHLGIDQILVYIMATYSHGIVMGYFNIVIYSLDQKTTTKSTCVHCSTLAT